MGGSCERSSFSLWCVCRIRLCNRRRSATATSTHVLRTNPRPLITCRWRKKIRGWSEKMLAWGRRRKTRWSAAYPPYRAHTQSNVCRLANKFRHVQLDLFSRIYRSIVCSRRKRSYLRCRCAWIVHEVTVFTAKCAPACIHTCAYESSVDRPYKGYWRLRALEQVVTGGRKYSYCVNEFQICTFKFLVNGTTICLCTHKQTDYWPRQDISEN